MHPRIRLFSQFSFSRSLSINTPKSAEPEHAGRQENMRLQSKVLRFDLGVMPPPNEPQRTASGMGEVEKQVVDELRDENAQLREDNDKLVEYLETLETKLAQGRASGGPIPVPGPAPALDRQLSSSGELVF